MSTFKNISNGPVQYDRGSAKRGVALQGETFVTADDMTKHIALGLVELLPEPPKAEPVAKVEKAKP